MSDFVRTKICESALMAAHMALSDTGPEHIRKLAPALIKAALRALESEANLLLAEGELELLLEAGFEIDPASVS